MRGKILQNLTITLLLSIAGTEIANAQTFEYKSHTNSTIANYSMPYRLFVPTGYNANTSYPLVLFLHGAGERGTDNNAPLNSSRGASLWAETANQASHPCFVIAPQCPSDKQWVNTNWYLGSYSVANVAMSNELKMVKDIIETLQTQYNIDPSRLYITGLSMGGYGTWDFIMRYPTMFKAAIPICGAGDPSKASLLSSIPLRVFHSSDDNIVPVAGSRDMVDAINALGPNTRTEFYTEYTNLGHVSWPNAYDTPDLVNWLFTVNPIKIGLTDITDQPGIITAQGENSPDQLKGNAFDNDTNTKWLDLADANPTTRASWIQYQLTGSSYVATQYTITSADDFPDRDPKNWSLLGSNDGSDWTTLDTKTAEEFSARSLKKTYTFDNSGAYTYYRVQINSVNNPTTATGVQLAELEILGIPAVASVSVSPTFLNLDKNDTKQLYVTVVPSNATPTVTWESSNEDVVTVSSTGLVTAMGAGNATITVAGANNNKIATCSVIVYDSGITKFEAENATLNGVWEVRDQQGYSGSGFIANFGNVGNYVQFSIAGATSGNQYITLRYATAVGCTIHLYVNGTMVRQVTLESSGSWGAWTDKEDSVTLNAGNNIIKYKMDASDGGMLNVDYLALRNIGISTGVIEIPGSEKENDILMFPNPLSTGSLTVKLPEDAWRLSVFDANGKIVFQKQVTKSECLIERSVFKSEGVYIVNVLTSKNSINKKVIVAK
jgi:poly(3-hydroxybutyrate) depolymerase/uncharacterized protein YjdB